MDLRNLPPDLSSLERVSARRKMIEEELGVDLSALAVNSAALSHAEERNCENMFGAVPIPVGLAGPLTVTLSDSTETTVYLPLATTEGALVASVNRGCKALQASKGVRTSSVYHGMTRSIAFRVSNEQREVSNWIREKEKEWKAVGEATSSHLKILSYDIDEQDDHLFLTIAADTDEAMGMNMVTIAAQAIGEWIEDAVNLAYPFLDARFITVAANIDSDKKPSVRTYTKGRGYEASASCNLQLATITEILKTSPEAMLAAAKAKLEIGSKIAGAIGSNCQAANIIAALYLATGQDTAHVVEGSLADTIVESFLSPVCPAKPGRSRVGEGPGVGGIRIAVRLPALMLGIRGGGTMLPAQKQCLDLLLRPTPNALHLCRELSEIFAVAVLAGEISLLAAQASHTLAKAHTELGR